MTKATTKTMTCPKCDGAGYIEAFAGIANGVCFRCAGNKVVTYRASREKLPAPLTEYQTSMIAKIRSGDNYFAGLTYGQLSTLRDFAHWPIKQAPTLLAEWRERGEKFFQAAQAERLAEMGY